MFDNPKLNILAAAFYGFAFALLGVVAIGFHEMDAGYLPMLSVAAMFLPLLAIYELVSGAEIATDDEIDGALDYMDIRDGLA